jgi:hypothetical protein
MARSRISASLPDKPSGERWNRKSFDSAARGQVAFRAQDQYTRTFHETSFRQKFRSLLDSIP